MPAASVLPWTNDEGDMMLIDGVGLETPIDYLAVTFIVSLVGFPVLTLPTPRRPDVCTIHPSQESRGGHIRETVFPGISRTAAGLARRG